MIRYLQNKSSFGLETVDQINSDDFPTFADFRKEQQRLLNEYRIAYNNGNMYWSQRPCKDYK